MIVKQLYSFFNLVWVALKTTQTKLYDYMAVKLEAAASLAN